MTMNWYYEKLHNGINGIMLTMTLYIWHFG